MKQKPMRGRTAEKQILIQSSMQNALLQKGKNGMRSETKSCPVEEEKGKKNILP